MMPALLFLQAAGQPYEIGSAHSEAMAYVKLLVVLGVILGVAVFGVHVLLPRIGARKRFAPGVIEVAARLPLEPRKNLYVLKIGAEYFLVGASESGMQCLTALKRDSVEAALDAGAPQGSEFSAWMDAFRRWKKAS